VVERGESARKAIGRLIRNGAGDAKSEVFRHHCHGRHQQEGIVDGKLHGIAETRVGIASIDVIDAKDVRDEEGVEQASFQELRQVRPIVEAVVA
jgi:hypothetical protein